MGLIWAKKAFLPIALAAMLAVGVVAAACDDDDDNGDVTPGATSAATAAATSDEPADGDAADVEAAVEAAFAAWSGKDVEGLVAAFTEEGLLSVFGSEGQTAAQVQEGLPQFIGDPPIEGAQFSDTEIDGTSATTDVTFNFGAVLDRSIFELEQEDGTWKISGEDQSVSPQIPEGTATFDMSLVEFAFDFDPAELATADDGVFAISASNDGEQPHEIVLVGLPAEGTLEELLQAEDADVTFYGQAEGEPGDEFDMVFTEALEPGRYAFVCFFPDTTEGPEGTPHALKGMATEFTVD